MSKPLTAHQRLVLSLEIQLRGWKRRALDAEKIVAAAREKNRVNLVEWRKARRLGKKRRPPGRPPGRPPSKKGRRKKNGD